MKSMDVAAAIIVVIGAINWGMVGALDVNLVNLLFGQSFLSNFVYVLVGLAGVYQAVQWKAIQNRWQRAEAVPA